MKQIVIILTFFLLRTPLCAQTSLTPEEIKEMRQHVVQGRVVVDYSTLYYEELGDGELVILIHDHSLSHRMWEQQFYDLSRSYHVSRTGIFCHTGKRKPEKNSRAKPAHASRRKFKERLENS